MGGGEGVFQIQEETRAVARGVAGYQDEGGRVHADLHRAKHPAVPWAGKLKMGVKNEEIRNISLLIRFLFCIYTLRHYHTRTRQRGRKKMYVLLFFFWRRGGIVCDAEAGVGLHHRP